MYPFHTVRRIVKDKLFDFKMIFQRLYRHDHVAKVDIWNAHAVIIKKIYPLIKAFVKFDLHGYPSSVKSMKEWRKILNEILFAFEFTYQEEYFDKTAKRLEAKMKRLYGDWDAKLPKNRHYNFHDVERKVPGGYLWITTLKQLTKEEKAFLEKKDGKDWMEKHAWYWDMKLHNKLGVRAQKGFELFGKYLMNLWD